jgi:hypothetical protein
MENQGNTTTASTMSSGTSLVNFSIEHSPILVYNTLKKLQIFRQDGLYLAELLT